MARCGILAIPTIMSEIQLVVRLGLATKNEMNTVLGTWNVQFKFFQYVKNLFKQIKICKHLHNFFEIYFSTAQEKN